MDAIARAIWSRGVDVEIVLSNVGTSHGYAHRWTCNEVGSEIIKRIKAQFPDVSEVELRKKVEDNIRICYVRHAKINLYESGEEIGNHCKYWIVDDICSYTGSQNFYVFDLVEWGVVIDDSGVTGQMLEDYWKPMWKASFVGTDCNAQQVIDGCKIDYNAEHLDASTEEGMKRLEDGVIAMAMARGLPHRSDTYNEDSEAAY